MQMSRSLGVMHPEDVLAQDAPLQGGGQPSEGALRRRGQGDRRQRRPELHAGGLVDKAPGQGGPGVLGGVAAFLPAEQHARLVRHPGPHLRRHLPRRGGLQHPVLRQRLHQPRRDRREELQVQIRVVL
jgi:hypothetical protein